METETKFRVWDKNRKLMGIQDKMYIYSEDEQRYDLCIFKFEGIISTFQDCLDHPKDYVLMQDTGLKDKNGKKIYDGDIVKNQANAKRDVRRTEYGEYKLFCGEHSNSFYKGWMKGTEWEVIGNIYEHPKLLNNKN